MGGGPCSTPEPAAARPELPNLLRVFLDRSHGHTRRRILLCGSAVRYMEALQQHQPLYGRMELTVAVHPFAPWEATLMLPELRPAERGGVRHRRGHPDVLGVVGPGGTAGREPARAGLPATAPRSKRGLGPEAGLGPTILQVLLDSLDDHQAGRWEAAFGQQVRRMSSADGESSRGDRAAVTDLALANVVLSTCTGRPR